jgi:aminocarboxymuconate-semialdehyde decarboxylase
VFSDDALRLLVAVMGIDRVMLGSDAPFPLGEEQPGRLVETSSHLSDDDRSAILGDNAVRFFGLSD